MYSADPAAGSKSASVGTEAVDTRSAPFSIEACPAVRCTADCDVWQGGPLAVGASLRIKQLRHVFGTATGDGRMPLATPGHHKIGP